MSNTHPIHRFTLGIFIAGTCSCILLIRGTHKGMLQVTHFTNFLNLSLMEQWWKTHDNNSFFNNYCPHVSTLFSSFSLSFSSIVALYSLRQDRQSVGALIGTHLTLCIAYLAIDLFKYRRMSLFLFHSSDHNSSKAAGGGEEEPSVATKINSESTITYVPGVKQDNWINVLGDIRNYPGKRRPMSPVLAQDDDIQSIDRVPVIKVGSRTNTMTKMLDASSYLENDFPQNIPTVIPRLQSSNTLRVPQRRGSATDASKLNKHYPLVSTEMSNLSSNSIGFSRGKSAIDLRKYLEADQVISLNRTLTQAQISGMAMKGKDKMRGNFIEDENGKIRERIIVRRKRSAASKDSLSVPVDIISEQQLTPPPLEKIHESSPVAKTLKQKASLLQLSVDIDQKEDCEEENVIKIAHSR